MTSEHNSPKPKTLVVGLGTTGLSCVRFLVSQGHQVAVADSRAEPPGLEVLQEDFPDVAVFSGAFDAQVFLSCEQIIVSPGVSQQEPCIQQARETGIEVMGDIELFARHVDAPVLAITGSNGKSTVTALLGEMAAKAGLNAGVGGNLGIAALDLLAQKPDLFILELSSFQLETVRSLHGQLAVILNISPDHLDRHGDLEHYIRAKKAIWQGAGQLIVNRDADFPLHDIPADVPVSDFSVESDQADFSLQIRDGLSWLMQGTTALLPLSEVKLAGKHNVSNMLAALAMGAAAGFPMMAMLEALRSFTGLPHRVQFVAQRAGASWFNDSKATNVGAAIAAIEGLDPAPAGGLLLIAGGDGKGAVFDELGAVIDRHCKAVILLGQDAGRIAACIGLAEVVHVNDMNAAVQCAVEKVCEGDRVLLSPACASLDMYSNYMQRGEAFATAVEALD